MTLLRAMMTFFVLWLATAGRAAAQDSKSPDKLTGWSKQAAALWWQQHPTPDTWESGVAQLHALLLAAQEEHGIRKAFSNKHFTAWLKHLRWLSLYSDENEFLSTPRGAAAFSRMGQDAPLLVESFTSSLSTYDNATRAVEILCEIYAADAKAAIEYRKLAVAFALVFDQPFPDSWPHPNTRKSQLSIGNENPVDRFQFYLRCVDSKAFLLDPKRLSVRELMCVVDTPLEFKELQYVQQVKLKSAARLQDVYQAIPYEKARLDDGALMWSGSSYRLIDIGRIGGICADQAFYMTQCGKAKGIPTVIFVGQGQNGGHAWTGFMPEPGKWDMSVAKYRQEKYPVGKAFDPQTWRKVTGDQLSLLVKAQGGGSSADKAARLVLQWAAMNPVHPSYAALLARARGLAPQLLEAWEMEEARLITGTSNPPKWRDFWQQWITAFRNQPDLEFRGQMRLLRALRAMGDTSAEERLRRSIESDNASGRFDLAIAIAADGVLELLEQEKLPEAQKAFGEVIDDFKSKAGGHLFYNLIVPYIDLALEKGNGKQASQALWAADSKLKFEKFGTVSADLKKLKDRVRSAEN
ncbi:MAG: hypothetical protein ACI9R3_003037 [Verrucomicrobiales bacterium]|jgi:hypothetical protein